MGAESYGRDPAPVYAVEFGNVDDAEKLDTMLNERASQGWTLDKPPVPILFKDGNVHSALFIFTRDAKVRKPLRGSK